MDQAKTERRGWTHGSKLNTWRVCLLLFKIGVKSTQIEVLPFVNIARQHNPDSKVYGANMGPTWGQQYQVGPMLAPWILLGTHGSSKDREKWVEPWLETKHMESFFYCLLTLLSKVFLATNAIGINV